MSTEFKMPDLGENIERGDVVSVLVAVGDRIEEDQPVIELETDKAVIEVPASAGGVVEAVHVKEGDSAAVGQLLLTISSADSAGDVAPQPSEEPAPAASPAEPEPAPAPVEPPASAPTASTEFKMPDLGENIEQIGRAHV